MLTKNGLPTYEAYVQFTPAGDATAGVSASWQVGVGVRPYSPSGTLSRYMNNTDISGGDYNKTHYPSNTDPKVCQSACDADQHTASAHAHRASGVRIGGSGRPFQLLSHVFVSCCMFS